MNFVSALNRTFYSIFTVTKFGSTTSPFEIKEATEAFLGASYRRKLNELRCFSRLFRRPDTLYQLAFASRVVPPFVPRVGSPRYESNSCFHSKIASRLRAFSLSLLETKMPPRGSSAFDSQFKRFETNGGIASIDHRRGSGMRSLE